MVEASVPMGGAGMKLAWEQDSSIGRRMSVQGILPNGPADTAGIRVGNEILGVAGEAVLGKNIEQVASLLTGVPGTKVELMVASKGGAPRTAVVIRQVLTQPASAKGDKGKQSAKASTSAIEAVIEAAATRNAALGAGESKILMRPLSASSDASFVHVEENFDDCFAALAQPEYAGKAAERLEAAVMAWRAGADRRSADPRVCDSQLLQFFAAWARELDAADVHQVAAGGDGGHDMQMGEAADTCGAHARASAAPTALLILSFGGKSKDGRGGSGGGAGGERIVVHLHAGALREHASATAASSLHAVLRPEDRASDDSRARENPALGETCSLTDGLDGYASLLALLVQNYKY